MLRKLRLEFGDIPLESITTRDLERYLTRRRNQDALTTSTTNRYLATLKTLFKVARNWDYIEDDPTERLKMAKERGGPRNSDSYVRWTQSLRGRI